MKCPDCGTETKYAYEATTLLGYREFEDALGVHHHDDNCLKRPYICAKCGHRWIESLQRTCNLKECDWKGKTTCFCHSGTKVEQWTDTDQFPDPIEVKG